MRYQSESIEQTQKIANDLAKDLKGGEVIGLIGPLGAGKTVFTKGLAFALGITDLVRSPSFVLMKLYPVAKEKIKTLCHIDPYRLKSTDEIIDIGADEYFGKEDTISVIEWADKIEKILPENTIWINLSFGEKENERLIEVKRSF